MGGITSKQEKFAQLVVQGITITDAYKEAYDAENMQHRTVQKRAHELNINPRVAARIEELRKPIIEKIGITLDDHLRDLLSLRNRAADEGQYSAAISAEVARGKAAGLHIDKSQILGANGQPLERIEVAFVSAIPGKV